MQARLRRQRGDEPVVAGGDARARRRPVRRENVDDAERGGGPMTTTARQKRQRGTAGRTSAAVPHPGAGAGDKPAAFAAARPPTNDTLQRQWTLLKHIPRAPKKIDVRRLQDILDDEGMRPTTRTVQRDLVTLQGIFPLESDDHKPQGWCWKRESESLHLPGLDAQAALAFHLVEKHLTGALPRAALRHLETYFANARNVLATRKDGGIGAWADRVRVIPRGVRLIPPKVENDVVDVVYEALFADRCFAVEYRKRGQVDVKRYEVNPLGLVLREGVACLVCTLNDYDDPLQLVLHRMARATLLDRPRTVPAGFDLDAYVNGGNLAFRLRVEDVVLRAAFDAQAGQTLLESHVAADQKTSELADGRVLVEGTVADTQQLRAWLRGYGDLVEVLDPKWLRDEIAASHARAAARYGK